MERADIIADVLDISRTRLLIDALYDEIDEFQTVRRWKNTHLDESDEHLCVCRLTEIVAFKTTDQPAGVDARLGSLLDASFDDILEIHAGLEAIP